MYRTPQFTFEDDDPALLGRFTAWMVDVVGHARIDFLRRQDRWKNETAIDMVSQSAGAYMDPLPSHTPKDEFDFVEDKLSVAFSRLTLMRRRVLTLIFVERLSAQEVAGRLNCSVKFVYNQKHEALKRLRDQLMEGRGRDEK